MRHNLTLRIDSVELIEQLQIAQVVHDQLKIDDLLDTACERAPKERALRNPPCHPRSDHQALPFDSQ